MAQAFSLTETAPFPTDTFGELDTIRPGFTFNPDWDTDFDDWKKGFEAGLPGLELNLNRSVIPSATGTYGTSAYGTGAGGSPYNMMDAYGNWMLSMKGKGESNLKAGYALKTAAAAGKLFSSMLNYGFARKNAGLMESNARQNAENQMMALDNQILYYRNQITDKFAETMARNSVTMATKNLRVEAGALLEQTKDAAYDATKDLQMLSSNAELKKIAIRSEAQQAKLMAKLTKKTAYYDMLNSLGELGITIGSGIMNNGYGNLFANESVADTIE